MTPDILDIALRVTALEEKINIVLVISGAIVVPVYAQMVNSIFKKLGGS